MNAFALIRAIRDADVPAPVKTLLYTLATYYSPTGAIWPSVATLAEACCVTPRSLQRHMRIAETLGWVERTVRPGKTPVYTLLVPVTPDTSVTPDTDDTPDTSVTTPLTPVSPEETREVTRENTPLTPQPPKVRRQPAPEVELRPETPPRVRRLRKSAARRWGIALHASDAKLTQWIGELEAAELTAVFEDVTSRRDFAYSKGRPMSALATERKLYEVLRAHAEQRPYRCDLPRVTDTPPEAPATGEKMHDVSGILRAFFDKKRAESKRVGVTA